MHIEPQRPGNDVPPPLYNFRASVAIMQVLPRRVQPLLPDSRNSVYVCSVCAEDYSSAFTRVSRIPLSQTPGRDVDPFQVILEDPALLVAQTIGALTPSMCRAELRRFDS